MTQYEAWGVVVETRQLRGAHIANGLVQLLRLFPGVPDWTGRAVDPVAYQRAVTRMLTERFGGGWKLSDAARALCVTTSKAGPLSIGAQVPGEPAFVTKGREHAERVLELGIDPTLTAKAHELISAALNADGRVYEKGGADPTTPTLRFAGYTSIHTLAGMHAATFLGLLCRTPVGAGCARELYALLADDSDPHTQLVRRLRVDLDVPISADARFEDAYPIPSGRDWDALAARVARFTEKLLAWNRATSSKSDALMAIVDLASLVLFLRLMQWRPDPTAPRPMLLMVSTSRRRAAEATVRAQQSLLAACGALDHHAERAELLDPDYRPSAHAQNLGANGGWLFPVDSRGAPKRWFCPGERQLATLARMLIEPGEEIAWKEFAGRAASELGLVVGGADEARMASALGLGGGANSVREAGRLNRDRFVALGLARQESDNVVLVDGGGR